MGWWWYYTKMDTEIHIYTTIYEMQAVPWLIPHLYLCHSLWLQICSAFLFIFFFFSCNCWLLSIFPLCFWSSLGLPDCQCKLKSPVLAGSIKWRELLRALISQAWARLREEVSECILLLQDQPDLSSKRRSPNSPFFFFSLLTLVFLHDQEHTFSTCYSSCSFPGLVWPLKSAAIYQLIVSSERKKEKKKKKQHRNRKLETPIGFLYLG